MASHADVNQQSIDDQSLKRAGNDISEYMLHRERRNANFFFGTKAFMTQNPNNMTVTLKGVKNLTRNDYSVGKPQDCDGHILVTGGAGSGKSTCIAMPTLETWGGTIFAIDIKGELSEHWDRLPEPKRPAKIFNLTEDQGVFASYDPFHFLVHDGEDNLVQNAREIAHAIIPLPPNVHEPFWIQSAQHVLTAAILHGCNSKVSFNATMTRILTVPIWELIEEIGKNGDLAAKLHINQFKGIKNPSDNKMLTGISAELNNKVIVFVTNLRIKDSFTPTADSIKWEDLESHNIFMRIPEDKLGQWDGTITLMLTQLVRSLERRMDKKYNLNGKPVIRSAKGKEIPPTLLLLDEFPRLGKVDVIQNAVSTLRSKGVTICLIMQSLAQLDRTYGKETRQIIVDNCPYKAILQVTDPENQKIFSDMVGSIKVGVGGVSKSTSESVSENIDHNREKATSTGTSASRSQTITESREPIIQPHEFATLKDIALMTPEGFCRVDKAPWYEADRTKKEPDSSKNPKTTDHSKKSEYYDLQDSSFGTIAKATPRFKG